MSFGSPPLNFHPPVLWPACSTPRCDGLNLHAPPNGQAVRFPHPGAWRTLADVDAYDGDQVLGVVRRYGALTASAQEPKGESIELWRRLVQELLGIATAWDAETGELRDKNQVQQAQRASWEMLDRILLSQDSSPASPHSNQYWRATIFVRDGHTVALQCTDMATYWRLQANYSIATQPVFRRCAFCGWWFALAGRRSDRKYCSEYHRTAASAGRAAPRRFWAEAV